MENISLIPVFLAIPVSALVYVHFSSTTTISEPHFHLSVVVYAVAAVLKLLSEPLYIRAQNELRLRALLSCQSRSSRSWSLRSLLPVRQRTVYHCWSCFWGCTRAISTMSQNAFGRGCMASVCSLCTTFLHRPI